MCGIVGAIGTRNILPVLVDGLKRLEYRGYDSCGVAFVQENLLVRNRSIERVAELEGQLQTDNAMSDIGIAHTRWATHGAPAVKNAHPHFSNGSIAVVHNGIIENYKELKDELIAKGYVFSSDTDTEVIAHLILDAYPDTNSISKAVRAVLPRLKGAYAIGVICKREPGILVAARHGSPLVVGLGKNENYIASDALALAAYTNQIIYLEEGDVVDVNHLDYRISNGGQMVERVVQTVEISSATAELDGFQSYMQKEIFEQPVVIQNTFNAVGHGFADGEKLQAALKATERVLILACGTSYYAGCVARYWFESIGVPCQVEVASEYRYRRSALEHGTLALTISQSGETADTLAAMRHVKERSDKIGASGDFTPVVGTLTVCNVKTSAMVRESDFAVITQAGTEIGVASTKAFTTQLVALSYVVHALDQFNNENGEFNHALLDGSYGLIESVKSVLALEPTIIGWAELLHKKTSAIFLGRGTHYPIAQEGALKLKEISYIHAEAYSAGELKHGPLALITKEMPVVVIAPNDDMVDKLMSNIQEVRARDGEVFVLADDGVDIHSGEGLHVLRMPKHHGLFSPILHVIALQLLAYHTALKLGNDVDKPRNLAKSVTVE